MQQQGFAPYDGLIEIHSALPTEYAVKLSIAAVSTAVQVTAQNTLLDPDRAGASNHLDQQEIADRPASLPGRSMVDLINSQPGWLYEGNAVLHPRGSEYQTQFVVDGIPLTDNRSPSFGPEIEADDVDSLTIYTAGIPAEYGRKMGGVVEVNTLRDAQSRRQAPRRIILSGGSFDTAGAFARLQDTFGKNTIGLSASGNMTAHYLNPVVPENFTNRGTTGDFSLSYERDFTPKDHLTLSVRHELARYEIPNEQVQQDPQLLPNLGGGQTAPPPGTPPQLQTADNFETMGIASYQHIFSPNILLDVRAMVRDNSNDFNSNPSSWPIIVFQHNYFREGYFNSSISIHHGHQEWKAGIESDNFFLHENFSDLITANPNDRDYPFDPGTASPFAFTGTRPDLEQAAFVQDLIHLGNWTVNAGLRWDHYQLARESKRRQPAPLGRALFPRGESDRPLLLRPRFSNPVVRKHSALQFQPGAVLRTHRSSPAGATFSRQLLRSRRHQKLFRASFVSTRIISAATSTITPTTIRFSTPAISFPIAFRKAIIYGAEAKLELPHWNRFSGFLSYSYIVGNAWFPVTGGLFIGTTPSTPPPSSPGIFPIRRISATPSASVFAISSPSRLWIAGGSEYGSGLPFDFNGTYQQALAEYGPAVVDRININSGRIKPTLSVDASLGAQLYKTEKLALNFQADGENLNNRLNIIDFGGLFSGNAIGPPRSYALRLAATFYRNAHRERSMIVRRTIMRSRRIPAAAARHAS